jgi:hypothetical protein
MLNDYTGSKVKEEMADFETKSVLPVIFICNACHGGEQDNPKGFNRLILLKGIQFSD